MAQMMKILGREAEKVVSYSLFFPTWLYVTDF